MLLWTKIKKSISWTDSSISKYFFILFYNSTFPHEKYIKDIEIWVYFKNTMAYLT